MSEALKCYSDYQGAGSSGATYISLTCATGTVGCYVSDLESKDDLK